MISVLSQIHLQMEVRNKNTNYLLSWNIDYTASKKLEGRCILISRYLPFFYQWYNAYTTPVSYHHVNWFWNVVMIIKFLLSKRRLIHWLTLNGYFISHMLPWPWPSDDLVHNCKSTWSFDDNIMTTGLWNLVIVLLTVLIQLTYKESFIMCSSMCSW